MSLTFFKQLTSYPDTPSNAIKPCYT